MSKVLAEYSSKSKPGRVYQIKEGNDGVIYCDCYQWKLHRTCKHLQDYETRGRAENVIKANEPDAIQQAINDIVQTAKGYV